MNEKTKVVIVAAVIVVTSSSLSMSLYSSLLLLLLLLLNAESARQRLHCGREDRCRDVTRKEWRKDGSYNYDSTAIRLPFDCNSSALRLFDDLQYDAHDKFLNPPRIA